MPPRFLYAILINTVSVASCCAAGFYLPNQDAFATGRGNAFVATANSPAAVYYNPAGLSQIDSISSSVGVYAIRLGNDAEVAGSNHEADREWQPVPHVYVVKPINDRIRLGLGLNSPFGLGTDWGDDTPFRTSGIEALIVNVSLWTTLSYKINDSLSIGAGFSLNYLDADLRQGIEAPGRGDFQFEGDDISLGYILALHWQPHEQHALGAVYRSHNDYNLSGQATTSIPVGTRVLRESANLDFVTPEVVSVGYSYRPNERWNIELNVDWIGWDRLNAPTLSTDSGNLSVPFNWESSFIYSLGASYRMGNGYTISAGYNYNENSQPDEDFTPLVSDADRHWVNFGLSRDLENWSWAVAYQFGFSNRTVSAGLPGTPAETANGRHESRHHAVILSLQRNF